jgi:hypothetical protein
MSRLGAGGIIALPFSLRGDEHRLRAAARVRHP